MSGPITQTLETENGVAPSSPLPLASDNSNVTQTHNRDESQRPAQGASAVRITFGGLSGKEWIIIVLLMLAAGLLGMNYNRLDAIRSENATNLSQVNIDTARHLGEINAKVAEQTRQTVLLKNHSDKLDNDVVLATQIATTLTALTRCNP
jgi:hypothetical protein